MGGKNTTLGHRSFVWNRQGNCQTAVGLGI
jgi:hypothetical protein